MKINFHTSMEIWWVKVIRLKDSEFVELVGLIKGNYGINLESKRHLVEGRLGYLLEEKGFSGFKDYFEFVFSTGSKEELTILLNKITTNHTFFMREKEHFSFFQQIVLPQLYQDVKNRDLRIWSAGCSSGEEPYTLAMILQDFFADQARNWDKKILATDICEEVLTKSSNGIYSSESIENLPPKWKYDFFKQISLEEYQVIEKLRKEIIFRIFNLMEDFPFKRKFHVIFCRNVMIYFDQKTKDDLIQKFYDMTEDGGYLFIGMSESIRRDAMPYQYVMPSVYRK